MAVMLTSGTSYTIPTGATTMKAWVVGSGGSGYTWASAGHTAYKTWSVSGGQTVAYSIPASPPTSFGGYLAGHTTLTFGGTTVRGLPGGDGVPRYLAAITDINDGGYSGDVTWLQFSGGDGLVWGGANKSSTGDCGSGYASNGGAVGGNSLSPAGNRRYVMTDISGLKAALTLAGQKVTDNGVSPAPFGAGDRDTKFCGTYSGNGFGNGVTGGVAGKGAIILYFT